MLTQGIELLTQAEYARHAGISRQAVSKMVKIGRIPISKDGKIDFAKADAARAEGEDPSIAVGKETAGTYTKARAAREESNAKLAQLEYEIAVKRVLPKASVQLALMESGRVIVQKLNGLVGEAENIEAAYLDNGTRGVRLHLKKCVRDLRQGIADALTETANDLTAGGGDD